MSNAIITGRIAPVRSVSGTIGAIPTLRAAFTTAKQYAGSPLTTGTVYHTNIIRALSAPCPDTAAAVYHLNIIRSLAVPTVATSTEIAKAVS